MKPEYDLSKLKSRENPHASKLKKPGTKRKLGVLKGQIWIAPDFDETPQEVIDSFWNSKIFPDEDNSDTSLHK